MRPPSLLPRNPFYSSLDRVAFIPNGPHMQPKMARIPNPSVSTCQELGAHVCTTTPRLWGAGDGTQDFLHAEQALTVQIGNPAFLPVCGSGSKLGPCACWASMASPSYTITWGSGFSERPPGDAEASKDEGVKAWVGTQNDSPHQWKSSDYATKQNKLSLRQPRTQAQLRETGRLQGICDSGASLLQPVRC